MAVSRAGRREERRARVVEVFGEPRAEQALDLLELLELAWHDCYAETTPPDEVVEDVLVLSRGDLGELIAAARLAVTDSRDARVAADDLRGRLTGGS